MRSKADYSMPFRGFVEASLVAARSKADRSAYYPIEQLALDKAALILIQT